MWGDGPGSGCVCHITEAIALLVLSSYAQLPYYSNAVCDWIALLHAHRCYMNVLNHFLVKHTCCNISALSHAPHTGVDGGM